MAKIIFAEYKGGKLRLAGWNGTLSARDLRASEADAPSRTEQGGIRVISRPIFFFAPLCVLCGELRYCGVKSRRFATVFASSFCSTATSRSTILSKSPRFIMPLCECV